jgi:hypothetical protein
VGDVGPDGLPLAIPPFDRPSINPKTFLEDRVLILSSGLSITRFPWRIKSKKVVDNKPKRIII